MKKQSYYAIKVKDLLDEKEEDYKTWEVIYIKAHNYHEAKNELKRLHPYDDHFLIPRNTLKHRDIIKRSTIYEDE